LEDNFSLVVVKLEENPKQSKKAQELSKNLASFHLGLESRKLKKGKNRY
jgi:hypothetical protein